MPGKAPDVNPSETCADMFRVSANQTPYGYKDNGQLELVVAVTRFTGHYGNSGVSPTTRITIGIAPHPSDGDGTQITATEVFYVSLS